MRRSPGSSRFRPASDVAIARSQNPVSREKIVPGCYKLYTKITDEILAFGKETIARSAPSFGSGLLLVGSAEFST